MRKKPLILVAFLMMSLFMIPSVTAGYGDESPQSITSFSETLPDDVLLFPDPFSIASGIYFADSGEGDWENTFEKDEVYFNVTDGDDLDIHFVCNATTVLIEKWEYAIFGFEIDDDGDCKYYQYPGWTSLETFNVTPSFYNGSIEPAGGLHGISNNYTLTLKFSIDYSATLCIDYVHIRFTYVPLSASGHYAEDFADVSDWTFKAFSNIAEGEYHLTTDGDVGNFTIECDSGDSEYTGWYVPVNNNEGDYLEIRYKTDSDARFRLRMDMVIFISDYLTSTGWTTFKVRLTAAYTELQVYLYDSPSAVDTPISAFCDYLRISPSNESGYQHDGSITEGVDLAPLAFYEDMSDISDWSYYNDEITTNGSVASITTSDDYMIDRYESNTPDGSIYWTDLVLEMKIRTNVSGSRIRILIAIHDEDNYAGEIIHNEYIMYSAIDTDWNLYSLIVTENSGHFKPECFTVMAKSDFNVLYEIDYIQVGRDQQFSDTGTISSDGDEVTLTADADGSIFAFYIDTTATAAQLSTALYPFLSLDFNDADSADIITVETVRETNFTVLDGVTIGTDPLRCNILAVDTYISQFWITLEADAVVRLEWIKAYSIAKYTITQSVSCETSDVFYVDSGALIGSKTTDYYQTFWYDPVLSVDTEMYNVVEANITKAGYPNVVGFNWAGTITGIGETWYLVDEKRAALDPSVLTDMRFSIDVLGDWTLSSIKYIDDHTWRGFTTVTVWFEVEAFVGTLNMLLIFGGLILIPASTLYAVKGGREAMNTDKLFYFLIAFVIGWALVIGGIYA